MSSSSAKLFYRDIAATINNRIVAAVECCHRSMFSCINLVMQQLTSYLQKNYYWLCSLWLVRLFTKREFTHWYKCCAMHAGWIYIFDDCCYYICTSFGSRYLRFQEFNSTHSCMRILIARHIVQRLSSKRVRLIEIRGRVRGALAKNNIIIKNEMAYSSKHKRGVTWESPTSLSSLRTISSECIPNDLCCFFLTLESLQ